MTDPMEVRGCVLAGRVVAASDVPAFGAAAEVYPLHPELQAFDAARAARLNATDVIEVRAGVGHGASLANS
jgi:hypothetical protein